MTTDTWLTGTNADWNTAADWSLGTPPSATTTASIGGTGAYTVTLFATGAAAGLTMTDQAAVFYDAGVLSLGGTLALQAGTLALAYGAIDGGTLALAGGTFLANGGTLAGVAVQGILTLTAAQSSLAVTGGLNLTGSNGSGNGSIALTGGYASLDFIGSQLLDHATIGIGATSSLPGQGGTDTLGIVAAGGASNGATLTFGTGLWLRAAGGAAQVVLGSTSPGAGPGVADALVNQGTITAATQGELLSIAGHGSFANQGTIGISNGATLALATGSFTNTGTITVSNATLSLGGTYSTSLLGSLGSISLSAGTIQLAGTATNAGTTLHIGSATALGPLSLTGTITGGTLADAGGGLNLSAGTGVLDDVTYAGVLDLSAAGAAVTLTDAARVSGPAGTGTITDTGAGSALLLRFTETLDHVQIALGAAGQAARIATGDVWLASVATTATLGANAVITQAGTFAAVDALGWSGVAGFGAADTLINAGSITAAFAGGRFTLGGYGTVINQGTITVSNADTLAITAAQFANSGTLTAGQGGTILLGQVSFGGQAPSWSNTGRIAVAGGTLTLGGAVTTSQLGSITETSGAVVLAGTLSNAGSTLTIGAGTGPLSLVGLSLTGSIIGGTVIDTSGALATGSGTTAVLDGVSYRGTLALTGAGSFLRIRNGLTLSGAADILGAGATLDFQGSQTFDHAQVLLGAAGTAASIDVAEAFGQTAATTLTLGQSLTITQSGQYAALGRPAGTGQPGDLIVNQGTITASVAGGTLTLGGPGFANQGTIQVGQSETLAIAASDFSNTGTLAVNGGTVTLSGSLTLAQLGQVTLSNGTIDVSGTLDLGGGTLSVGQGSAIGRLVLTGTITDGTITDTGGGLAVSGGATLDNVTYDGTLDLSRPFAQLAIAHGIDLDSLSGTPPGTVLLTGAQSRLIATTTETIHGANISLGSVAQYYAGQRLAAPELAAASGVQLTIGAAASITLAGTSGTLGDSGLGQWSDSIVNQGQITAATQGGVLNLASTFFTNAGTITTATSGIAVIGDAGFVNSGTIAVGAGSAVQITLLDYYAAPDAGAAQFTNSGTIALAGGIVQELTANGLFPAVPLANSGDIVGSGLLFAQVANAGTIEARNGLLLLAQPVLGSGAIAIDPTGILELASTLPSNQLIDFAGAGGTLTLDSPATFTGTLDNFAAGDVIDLPGQILTGVGLSSGTLVASTATQNYRFVGNVPLGGEVSAGHDAHGGATIAFVQQTPGTGGNSGGAPALIEVTQSNMLFWASPAGDVFQGMAAHLEGAHISNWGGADSLDITDMAPASAHLALSQGTGLDTVTISSGSLSFSLGLTGTFAPSLFHVSSDGHGGTVLSYGH